MDEKVVLDLDETKDFGGGRDISETVEKQYDVMSVESFIKIIRSQMISQPSSQRMGSSKKPYQKRRKMTNADVVSGDSVSLKLGGRNYALWSHLVESYISGKDKVGYINGELPPPPTDHPSYQKWHTENSIVKRWLLNSIEPSLIPNFIKSQNAKKIWDSLASIYSDGNDKSQIFELRRRVLELKQGGGSVKKFYTSLQTLWREIDLRRSNPMKCHVDIQMYNKIVQEDRVYTFLAGLDDTLDCIRNDVLRSNPFPTIEEAFAKVQREAMLKVIKTKGTQQKTISSCPDLQLTTPQYNNVESILEDIKLSHCGENKHTKETCLKVHEYPEIGSMAVMSNEKGGYKTENPLSCTTLNELLSNDESNNLDIHTKEIIEHGIERDGLYNLDDAQNSHDSTIQGTSMEIDKMVAMSNKKGGVKMEHPLTCIDLNELPSNYERNTSDVPTKELIECGIERDGLYNLDDAQNGHDKTVEETSMS